LKDFYYEKKFPLLIIVLATNAAAQSGRRIIAPPPSPPAPETESTPAGRLTPPAELSSLPKSVLKRKLQSLDKSSFRIADFGGKVIVVNLWATWCGPCRMEVPEYEQVRKDYEGRGVEFIALTVEAPRVATERVKQFVRDFNFGFRLGWADRETALTLTQGRTTIPQTLVIAPDGHILSHWRGYSRGHNGDSTARGCRTRSRWQLGTGGPVAAVSITNSARLTHA
jgi:thiol-disulfide isomerase/thioredoxin